LFGITPALFCKERVVVQQKITFREALSETLKNKPFLNVAGITVFMAVGYSMAIPLLYYVNMAYLFPGDENQASSWMMYLSWAYSVVGFMCVPVVYLLSKKIGKRATLVTGLSMVLIGALSSWFYYTPKAPWLQFFYAMTFSPGLTCAWVILPSMISDICDMDELKTGRRREGVYGAVFTFVLKLGVSLTMMISGVIITWAGYNRECAIQTEDTIMKIRAAFAFLPMGFLLVAIILALKYPVTRQNIIAVQKKLNGHRTDPIKKECISDE
jgi:glycoside/pentoside/hexuronide:cation symporter, GPH family